MAEILDFVQNPNDFKVKRGEINNHFILAIYNKETDEPAVGFYIEDNVFKTKIFTSCDEASYKLFEFLKGLKING
jgi:hypothetical protein